MRTGTPTPTSLREARFGGRKKVGGRRKAGAPKKASMATLFTMSKSAPRQCWEGKNKYRTFSGKIKGEIQKGLSDHCPLTPRKRTYFGTGVEVR